MPRLSIACVLLFVAAVAGWLSVGGAGFGVSLPMEATVAGLAAKPITSPTKFDGTALEFEYDRYGQLAYERHHKRKPTGSVPTDYLQERNYGYDGLGRLTVVNQPLHREATSNPLARHTGGGNYAFQGPVAVPENTTGSPASQKDLYHQRVVYDYADRTFGTTTTTAVHGGLIQETVKSVLGRKPVLESYGYDRALRLERFEAWEVANSSAPSVTAGWRHAMSSYAYDALSRPTALLRTALSDSPPGGSSVEWRAVDALAYTYEQSPGLNRVRQVTDAVVGDGGHRKDASPTGYYYDAAGNVSYDGYKRVGFTYNALGLVSRMTIYHPTGPIYGTTDYRYSADGTLRVSTEVTWGGVTREVYHVDGHRYDATARELYYAHAEGASLVDAAFNTKLIGYHTDHLGNVILAYSDLNGNGGIDPATEFLEEQQYWPYGMVRDGYSSANRSLPFAFNGAERDDRLGLHLTTYRTMASETALWGQTDPKAEWDYGVSPYSSMRGNPIRYNDPDGDCIPCIAALVGGVINIADQGLKGNLTSWGAAGGYFLTGAAAGALASTGNVGAARAVTLIGNKGIQVVTGRLSTENLKSPQGIAMLGLDIVGDLTQVDLTRAVARPLIRAWATRAAPAVAASVAGVGTAGSFNYLSAAMDAVEWTGGNVVVRASASSSAAGAGAAANMVSKAGSLASKAAKTYSVYEGYEDDVLKYVGITSRDQAVRYAEHVGPKALLDFRPIPNASGLTRDAARVMEQNLVNERGLNNLYNKINSIDPTRWGSPRLPGINPPIP